MKNEIKEILDNLKDIDKTSILKNNDAKILLDYITNLQQENKRLSKNQRYCKKGVFSLEYDKETLRDMVDDLQREIERLKQELNCKEYFSSTMPENTEFVILTKNNYDRQQKDIELEFKSINKNI